MCIYICMQIELDRWTDRQIDRNVYTEDITQALYGQDIYKND